MSIMIPQDKPTGVYTAEHKQRAELVIQNKSVSDVIAYIETHADVNFPNYKYTLDYVRGKGDFLLDVVKLDGELHVHYTNQTKYDKYYYTLRITTFKVKD